MYFDTTPTSSPSSTPPISIGFPSPSGSMAGMSQRDATSTSTTMTCAYPSWPAGNSLSPFRSSAPSSFISDIDLFPDSMLDENADTDGVPFLEEAPALPRPPRVVAAPLLPLYASNKPAKKRRGSRKQRRPSKPMTPISESPEAPE